jgi:hypothetical protein
MKQKFIQYYNLQLESLKIIKNFLQKEFQYKLNYY